MVITIQRFPSSGNGDIWYSGLRVEAFGAVVAYPVHEVTRILTWMESMDGYTHLSCLAFGDLGSFPSCCYM